MMRGTGVGSLPAVRGVISDPIFLLKYLFTSGVCPTCLDSADTEDSGKIDITDAIYSLSFLFLGGPAPASSFPGCGTDATIDDLDCQSYAGCQ